jgi:NTP pyrophosphatase (non-canonical NTP hydrolase)
MAISLATTGDMIYKVAKEKGFWDDDIENFTFLAYKLAMIHSEVTEVLEAVRKSQGPEKVSEEFADIIIRVLDLYEGLLQSGQVYIPLEDAVLEKVMVNGKRERMHGVKG